MRCAVWDGGVWVELNNIGNRRGLGGCCVVLFGMEMKSINPLLGGIPRVGITYFIRYN